MEEKQSHLSCCSKGGGMAMALIAAALVVGVLLLGFKGMTEKKDVAAKQIKEEAVQAVFLTNGQVYFGDITALDEETLALEGVFYLQVDQALQTGENKNEAELSLVKLGPTELHSPEDKMVISRDQVLFWENLTADSEVVKAMQSFDEEATAAEQKDSEKKTDGENKE